MNDRIDDTIPFDPLGESSSLAQLLELDELDTRLREMLLQGESVDLVELVSKLPVERRAAAIESLLASELHFRAKRGALPGRDSYLKRYFDYATIVNLVFDDAEGHQPPATGQCINRFEIIEHLGRGSFGDVFAAYDPHLDVKVAIKVPRADREFSKDELERITQEARAAIRLVHANIVRATEVVTEDSRPIIVFDFVDGISLSKWHKAQGKLAFSETSRIITVLADAVDFAHRQGVFHRDIKPANILMDEHNEPRILDFGLAKISDGKELTLKGAVMGTLGYMPPEQAKGLDTVSATNDIYSLGVVMFELLTGRLPYKSVHDVLEQLDSLPPQPRHFDPDVPFDLNAICWRCLQKKPKDRFKSGAELAKALREDNSGMQETLAKANRVRGAVNLLAMSAIAIGVSVLVWWLIR